jgi:preprotein translocase subunit Sec63
VHRSATDQDIRSAYKKLSKRWHPDKNKEENAKDRFVEITRGTWAFSEVMSYLDMIPYSLRGSFQSTGQFLLVYTDFLLNCFFWQKREIYDRHGEVGTRDNRS